MMNRVLQTFALFAIFLVTTAADNMAQAGEGYCEFDCQYADCVEATSCLDAMSHCDLEDLPFFCDGCDYILGVQCWDPCDPYTQNEWGFWCEGRVW